ncbi:unnamed protein product [Caenorhabditis bovis]|uniref:Uncharacterized protein n=1 Tax=Caenorhabditis bovis TaxID=2654633 RepID=A0A8S1F2C2_9PELO|nr:unnamed protein product [Caenorhabditis bovis]
MRDAVFGVLQNVTDPNSVAIDSIQAQIEEALYPMFVASGGVWLVSANFYHRVTGYVDDKASVSETFCAVNDIHMNIYVVITRVE